MTPFEYLAVLISIVLGFGITELLAGVQRLVHHRDEVVLHWLPLTWSGIVFVALVQWWWAAFGFRDRMEWNFFSFLLILLVPVLYYLAAALVLPLGARAERFDLRAHYFAVHRLFFGTVATATMLEALRAAVVRDAQATLLNLVATALLAALAIVRNPRAHAAGTLLAAALLAAFIVAETLRIA